MSPAVLSALRQARTARGWTRAVKRSHRLANTNMSLKAWARWRAKAADDTMGLACAAWLARKGVTP